MAVRDRWFPQLEGKEGVAYPVAQALKRAFEIIYDLQDQGFKNLEGVHGDREASFPANSQSQGVMFWETDRLSLYVVSETSGAAAWTFVTGLYSAALEDIPTDLNENDKGFLFHSTDYEHLWRWSGSAWAFAPGDPGSKFIVAGIAVPFGGVWQACDGTAVDVAQVDASTASVTTPDLTGEIFLKGNATYSGTRQAATVASWDAAAVTDDESAHTHTGGSHSHGISGSTEVQSGTGATVNSGGTDAGGAVATSSGTAHSHPLSDANAVLDPPSEADGGLPLRMNLIWYMRR